MIYLVEDDRNIRKLVSYALLKEGYSVKDFASPDEFWSAMDTDFPDLILLDIMLPKEDGLSILSKIRASKKTRDIPVIMLTAKSSEFDKVTGLDMGADDYISKPFGIMEMISRIKAVLRRSSKKQQSEPAFEEYRIGPLYVNHDKHIIKVDGRDIPLALKEYELLHTLLKANGKVLSRDFLFNNIWGYDFDGESRTVDVHIRKLRQKLGECGGLIETVKGIGYKIGADEYE